MLSLNPHPLGRQVGGQLPQEFSVVTWNVWFDKFHRDERNIGLLTELKALRPHIIALQEVTPPFVRAIQACEWLKEDGYWVSGLQHNEIGAVLLARVPVEQLSFRSLTSQMGRRLLLAEFQNGLHLATAHFESNRNSSEVRKQQLQECFEILPSDAILLGDFNSAPEDPENEAVPAQAKDAWTVLHPDSEGYTFDTETNPTAHHLKRSTVQVRMDRILYQGGLQAQEVRLLGTRDISDGLRPSDHYGLWAKFTRA